MDPSAAMLALGLAMAGLGVFLIFLSMRTGSRDVETRGMGVIMIGPIPIIIGGSRRWIVIALVAFSVIAILMLAARWMPELVGW